MSTISWNSSSTRATLRSRSAPSRPGSSNSRSSVASMSWGARLAVKEKDIVPSSGSTVTVGRTRRPWKTFIRSLARNSAEATSS